MYDYFKLSFLYFVFAYSVNISFLIFLMQFGDVNIV